VKLYLQEENWRKRAKLDGKEGFINGIVSGVGLWCAIK